MDLMRYMQKFFVTVALCTSLCLLAAEKPLPGADNKLAESRAVLAKWVESQQLLSKTRTDWQADKESLLQSIKLIERELASVEEQAGRLTTNNAQAEKEQTEAQALLKSSDDALDLARQFVTEFEGRVRQITPRLPLPLQDILKPHLNRLPADPAKTKMSAAERTQALVSVLNEFDKFNNAITLFPDRRKNARGEEVAVETVYVGLGAAYFVNDADDFAGRGVPGASGWEWTTASEIASTVREVIRIYRNERPARFVGLPTTVR